jgi:hypothetical protein
MLTPLGAATGTACRTSIAAASLSTLLASLDGVDFPLCELFKRGQNAMLGLRSRMGLTSSSNSLVWSSILLQTAVLCGLVRSRHDGDDFDCFEKMIVGCVCYG